MSKHILDNSISVFLALIRAGLWEKDVQLSCFEPFDANKVYKLAQEQAVVGLVAAGIEHAKDVQVPKDIVLSMVGDTLQLEQRNAAMNSFICILTGKLQEVGIRYLLVKGQGVAQRYERPLWRACGDVDLLLEKTDLDKAKNLLQELSNNVGEESKRRKDRLHFEYHLGDWIVELHGTMYMCLSNQMDRVLDEIQNRAFSKNAVRYWQNGNTQVALPVPDDDVVFVFSHILQHLFLEGVGLRQICDLSRLLWTFRGVIDKDKLYYHLSKMGVVSEWKVFGCLMVDTLGFPKDDMPFYDKSYKKKSERLLLYIVESGNFGHNRDMSHLKIEQSFIRKTYISCNHFRDCVKLSGVFPIDAVRFYYRFMVDGIVAVMKRN